MTYFPGLTRPEAIKIGNRIGVFDWKILRSQIEHRLTRGLEFVDPNGVESCLRGSSLEKPVCPRRHRAGIDPNAIIRVRNAGCGEGGDDH